MTTHELLEMVSLDALGLLDDDERADFESAFRVAPPAVQAQVRREQARFARGDALLPQIEPPPGLRARVIAAVREAIAGRLFVEDRRTVRGVSPIWRAAAIGCAAAAIVLAVTTLHMRARFDEVTDMTKAIAQADLFVRDFGPRFRSALFSGETKLVHFAPGSADRAKSGGPLAVLLLEGDKTSGQLLLDKLPGEAGEYSLNIVDAEGQIVGEALVTFRSTDLYKRIQGLKLEPGQGLAIVAPGKAKAMLRSIQS